MTLSRGLLVVLLGLGSSAGAVLPAPLAAQVPVRRDTVPTRVDTAGRRPNLPPAGRDTIRIPMPARADSMIRNDSAIKGVVPLPVVARGDTIKPPLARAEAPHILEIGPQRIYDRSALFATGAVTMSDLLSRVPGLTEFTTGFALAPAVVASMGDLRRIRIFLDGLELDPMDRRARGVSPVNDLPLHALEEVRIERAVEEVRVYARSWRVDRTVPFTRADIATGDLDANLYRAYYGRRYAHGEVLQVSAEQFNTQPDRRLPSSDLLNLMLRAGLTRGPWSTDAFLERTHRNRAPWRGTGDASESASIVPGVESQRNTAYVRLGNGDPEGGRWFQLLASAHSNRISARTTTDSDLLPADEDTASAAVDTSSFVSQYLLTGGMSRWGVTLSAAERIRIGEGRTSHVLSGRATGDYGPLSVSLFGEGRSYLNPSRAEATVKLSALNRLVVVGSASQNGEAIFDRLFVEPRSGAIFDPTGAFRAPENSSLSSADTSEVTRYQLASRSNLRAELGMRLRDVWVSGGIIRRGPTTLLAPSEFDVRYAASSSVRPDSAARARTASIRGRIWKSVHADAWAVAWDDSTGLYRPQYQTRSELYVQTNLLKRFPKGNFGILSSLSHEYRSSTRFAVGDTVATAPGYRALAFKLEIRIQTAVISYQFRNLLQERYSQIPGFNLPRQTQFYGIRWDFWN